MKILFFLKFSEVTSTLSKTVRWTERQTDRHMWGGERDRDRVRDRETERQRDFDLNDVSERQILP